MEHPRVADLSVLGRRDYKFTSSPFADNASTIYDRTHEQNRAFKALGGGDHAVFDEKIQQHEGDHLPTQYRGSTDHLQTGSPGFSKRLATYSAVQSYMRNSFASMRDGIRNANHSTAGLDAQTIFTLPPLSRPKTQERIFRMLEQRQNSEISMDHSDHDPVVEERVVATDSFQNSAWLRDKFICTFSGCLETDTRFATRALLELHKLQAHRTVDTDSDFYRCCVSGCPDTNKLWDRNRDFEHHIERIHPHLDAKVIMQVSHQEKHVLAMEGDQTHLESDQKPNGSVNRTESIKDGDNNENRDSGWSKQPFCNGKLWISHTISEDRSGNDEIVSQQRLAALGARGELNLYQFSTTNSLGVGLAKEDARLGEISR